MYLVRNLILKGFKVLLFCLYIMPPGMVYDNFPDLCPHRQACRINFRSGRINMADSVTPSDRVIMRVIIGRGDLQRNVGSKS
jgi:hypothetical protein